MSCVPDAYEFPKVQIIQWMRPVGRKDRSIDRSIDLKMFFVENLVRVISVAANVAVV